ncbi:MAG TPA: Hsp20/alpha crystallin family protein [Xanthobacteraceae bacterium]|nr:Hsp20/alpha crystallin family protein [Xanthobacteraceae bacterium]
MAMRDLIPWRGGRDVTVRRGDPDVNVRRREHLDPFLALHREMNRVFDDVFRGFDLMPFGSDRIFDRGMGWPNIEVNDFDNEIKVTAEIPGLDEQDVDVQLANGVLSIRGERKTETTDEKTLFSERYYGRFERRIPVEDIDEDKVAATFKNGVLTVTLPKTARAQQNVRRISINGKTKLV